MLESFPTTNYPRIFFCWKICWKFVFQGFFLNFSLEISSEKTCFFCSECSCNLPTNKFSNPSIKKKQTKGVINDPTRNLKRIRAFFFHELQNELFEKCVVVFSFVVVSPLDFKKPHIFITKCYSNFKYVKHTMRWVNCITLTQALFLRTL